ncbi:unnamed protein product [Adineta ricciae]|uniref:G-protein coupled receptors family 1 profile domain-containing protein n=1 Tax=Adineta ricciae TaxID=249248 RepID=A0A813VTR1_ADIRI|nr:unnamed protein product [Adineta ricciae]CAF1326720.1 unnamed protein product [Adineta ricciae]
MFPLFYALNHIDIQVQSVFFCKIRLYIVHVLGLVLRYVVVLACIDRFVITRANIRVRSLSSIRMAVGSTMVMIVLCFLIAMHLPILTNIRNGVCGMIGLYKVIYSFYQIIVVGLLPPILMIIFSALTIQNLWRQHASRLSARRRDRNLMRMLIAEVTVDIVISIPYSANLIHGAVVNNSAGKSTKQIEIETFITFFTQFLIYITSVVPFYLFLCASKPFQREFLLLISRFWYQYVLRRVQVRPIREQTMTHV